MYQKGVVVCIKRGSEQVGRGLRHLLALPEPQTVRLFLARVGSARYDFGAPPSVQFKLGAIWSNLDEELLHFMERWTAMTLV